MYIQTIISQRLEINGNGINLTIPDAKLNKVIVSNNLNDVQNNYLAFFNLLSLNNKNIEPIGQIDFSKELKIDETKYIKLIVTNIENEKILYKFYITNTEIGYGLNY